MEVAVVLPAPAVGTNFLLGGGGMEKLGFPLKVLAEDIVVVVDTVAVVLELFLE